MNPLYLSDQHFLVLYTFLVAVVCGTVGFRVRTRVLPLSGFDTADPYAIAYLQGGTPWVVRVAVLSLLHRGWVEAREEKLRVTEAGRAQAGTATLEAALLEEILNTPTWTLDAAAVRGPAAAHLQPIKQRLEAVGALLSQEGRQRLKVLRRTASALLIAVAGIKIAGILWQGRKDVESLMALCGIGLWVLRRLVATQAPHPTRSGEALLRHLKHVHGDVYVARKKPNKAQGDPRLNLMLLAAVYGFQAVPPERVPAVSLLMPPSASNGDEDDSFLDAFTDGI